MLVRLIVASLGPAGAIAIIPLQFDWTGVAGMEQAGKIDTLLDVMIVPSSFVYSVVLVMLGYCIWRYRQAGRRVRRRAAAR